MKYTDTLFGDSFFFPYAEHVILYETRYVCSCQECASYTWDLPKNNIDTAAAAERIKPLSSSEVKHFPEK